MVWVSTKPAKHRAADRAPRPASAPRRTSVLSAILIVMGIVVLLVPVVLTKLHNADQVRIAEQYSASIREMPVELRDPWSFAPDPESPEYQEYLSVLAMNPVMARLRVPSVGIDLPVYHGSTEKVLAQGAGHVFGSAFPIGGEGTHAALTGHTGVSTSTMFDNLHKVKLGDTFTVETLGKRVAYRVDNIIVVKPEDTQYLQPVQGKDYVTLITCTPYGINSHRLLVRGERLPDDSPALAENVNSDRWQWWMLLAMGLSALAFIYLILGFVKRKKGQQ